MWVQLSAQEISSELSLPQMVDSVNYLLRNCEDRFVQPVFSINEKGDISILDKKKSGFRFNISILRSDDSTQNVFKGIEFVPERPKSITTNKIIQFIDQEENRVGLLMFTRTDDTYVRKIYGLLVQIRSYFANNK